MAAVYDGVGKTTFAAGLPTRCAPYGRMILYGGASGEPDPVDPHTLESEGSLYLQRPTLRRTRARRSCWPARGRALRLVAAGELKVAIGGRYPLAEARRAHEDLEARRTTGKLLLVP